MSTVWVVGSRGLLGRALVCSLRASGQHLFEPSCRFDWLDVDGLAGQMLRAVDEFASQVDVASPWSIFWAAGIGTFQGTVAAMTPETTAFAALLAQLEAAAPRLPGRGAVALASSAGSIYAACADSPITEASSPTPTTAYACAKLEQEALLAAFAARQPGIAALSARLSTLYGPGQAQGKSQGLMTHIARCIVRNQPVNIFVPLDTIRDYIATADAAQSMVAALAAVQPGCCVTKIIASEKSTTISEIVSVFKRISRRAPRIVTSASRASRLYSRKVEYRSQILPDTASAGRLSLAVGIAQILQFERARYVSPGAFR